MPRMTTVNTSQPNSPVQAISPDATVRCLEHDPYILELGDAHGRVVYGEPDQDGVVYRTGTTIYVETRRRDAAGRRVATAMLS